jgi:predicted nucleotidyltransferase component of viral defense system
MIQKGEINKKARINKVSDKQIEKDYVLTWVLYGISENELLKKALAFKGGTVLKKAYFHNYRFSEDLDFTLLDEKLTNKQILNEFNNILEFVEEETAMSFRINEDADKEHAPSGSFKFWIEYVAPLDGAIGSRDLKIDVTRGEKLEFDLIYKPLDNSYSDISDIDFTINCYSLSEVLIEKMAAVMGRTIPRDLYDLWYLLGNKQIDLEDHYFEFERKAEHKGHDSKEFRAKLAAKEGKYQRDWETSLGDQIYDLPKFKDVMRELNKYFRALNKYE